MSRSTFLLILQGWNVPAESRRGLAGHDSCRPALISLPRYLTPLQTVISRLKLGYLLPGLDFPKLLRVDGHDYPLPRGVQGQGDNTEVGWEVHQPGVRLAGEGLTKILLGHKQRLEPTGERLASPRSPLRCLARSGVARPC